MPGNANRQPRISPFLSNGVILFVGDKDEPSTRRSAALTRAGYDVLAVFTAEEALLELARTMVGVVVLGHHINRGDRLRIEEAVTRLRPRPRIILLYQASIAEAQLADAVLNVNGEPHDLVRTVQYLLTGEC